MSTSSEQPASASAIPPGGDPSSVPSVAELIHGRVDEIVDRVEGTTEFYQRLAELVLRHFSGGLVAVDADGWSGPVMLVNDDVLAENISRPDLISLLGSATASPVACNLPLVNIADDRAADGLARGLRIELIAAPRRSALIMIYPLGVRPAAITQIEDLRHLHAFGDASRDAIEKLSAGHPGVSPNDDSRHHDSRHHDSPGHESPSGQSPSGPSPSGVAAGDVTTSVALSERRAIAHHRSLQLLHRDLDLDATCFRIANESRRLLSCDRSTVLVKKAGTFRVAAVSGIAVVDRRANSVRAAERMTAAAVVMSRPLVLPGREAWPPQLQAPLDDYLDQTGVAGAIVLPLHSPDDAENDIDDADATNFDALHGDGECLGVMVLEYFTGDMPTDINVPMSIVAGESAIALRNAIEHRSVFGLRLWKAVGKTVTGPRWPWLVAGMVIAFALLTASMVIRIDHQVIAVGTAEPTLRRDVFAGIDGVVKRVHVVDGQSVSAGDMLFELENAELESRAEALAGEIQTASQRLASIQAVRLSGSTDPDQSSRMAIEERQVQSELTSLQGQLKIVQAQQDELVIHSPIAGVVVGWQLDRRLNNRPVTRGNILASVVNPSGPWSLRLQVRDADAGDVIDAAKQNASLPISFAVATEPESSFAAELSSIATASRLDETGQYVIDADAVIQMDAPESESPIFDVESMRSGADVTAKIACGKRSVLRSWFGDVFDFVHRNVLFYF